MSERPGSVTRQRVDFLAGVRVLEIGDGVAGAAATSILWALGAEVTAVIDLSSPHRRGRPRLVLDGDARSLLPTVLDRGKRLVEVGGPAQLDNVVASAWDVVVVDRVRGGRGALASLPDVESYLAFVQDHNRGAWLTISAFGLTGERAREGATELTVAAAGGMLAAVRDQRTGQPLKLAGYQSLLNTGQAGALAACHALDLVPNSGPVHLDLSAVAATIATGPVLEVGGLLLNTGSAGGAKRYGAPASFYGCSDGLIRISAMEEHQWKGLVVAMGSPPWADHFAGVEARIRAAEQVDEHVAAWTRMRTKQDAETVLQAHGVPATAVYSPSEILRSPQLAHRDALEPLPVDSENVAEVVGLPFRFATGGNGRAAGKSRRRSLRGLRVLEASRVLAVPLCGAILGALGAEVTKLEDIRRLDMYRRRGPYIDAHPDTAWSAYFALMNHSKRSVAFDVDANRDRLDELLGRADVVVENLGAKRGLTAFKLSADYPELLAVSSSGFGQDGPHAGYRAYAYNLQASCALGYLTRDNDGESAEIDIAWADLTSAYALATIIAAWAVGPAGNRGLGVDFAMADLVISHFNEFLAAVSLGTADDDVDRANELSPYAPNGVYPAADGWIALSVEDDEKFTSLTKVLAAESSFGPTFVSAEARFDQRRLLDDHLAKLTGTHSASELAAKLRGAGVSAEKVATPPELVENPELGSSGFLAPVEHPEWGRRRLVGIPWRVVGGPALALGAPPLLRPLDGAEL